LDSLAIRPPPRAHTHTHTERDTYTRAAHPAPANDIPTDQGCESVPASGQPAITRSRPQLVSSSPRTSCRSSSTTRTTCTVGPQGEPHQLQSIFDTHPDALPPPHPCNARLVLHAGAPTTTTSQQRHWQGGVQGYEPFGQLGKPLGQTRCYCLAVGLFIGAWAPAS
jgi:hypothetical protein